MNAAAVPPQPEQIAEWLAAARRGSAEDLGRILEACRPYLLHVANQNIATDLQAKLGASDLVQETFLEAQRDFGRFAGDTEVEWRAWLCRLLLNNLANQARLYRQTDKRQLEREVALPGASSVGPGAGLASTDSSPSAQVRACERDEALARALEQLPEPQREIIRLHHYEDLSFEEAGRRLGRSADAARKLWGRAIDQLQQLLEAPDESR